jgi:hypothetical protein
MGDGEAEKYSEGEGSREVLTADLFFFKTV